GQANEHAALIGRLQAFREVRRGAAVEVLVLRIAVARRRERKDAVVPRMAADALLDRSFDRGIGHGCGGGASGGSADEQGEAQRGQGSPRYSSSSATISVARSTAGSTVASVSL